MALSVINPNPEADPRHAGKKTPTQAVGRSVDRVETPCRSSPELPAGARALSQRNEPALAASYVCPVQSLRGNACAFINPLHRRHEMARQPATTRTTARAAKSTNTTPSPELNEGSEAPLAQGSLDREQAIREAAYACFEARGCEPGHELDDWLTAEAQVQQANGGAASGSGIEQVSH